MPQHNIQEPQPLFIPDADINTMEQIRHLSMCAHDQQLMKTTYFISTNDTGNLKAHTGNTGETYTVCPLDAVYKVLEASPKLYNRKITFIGREPFLSFIQ